MLQVLFDTNVVLDVLLKRQPWVVEAQKLWAAVDDGRVIGYLSATSVANIFYIARKAKGIEAAFEAVGICLETFEICVVDRDVLRAAFSREQGGTSDFEDNIQIACGSQVRVSSIVTSDTSGFNASAIRSVSPAELLQQLSAL